MGRIWDDVISERDKQVYAAAGYGRKSGLGRRPALLIVDILYNFVGDRPEPILASIQKYRNSCGEDGWRAVHATVELLKAARAAQIPIVYAQSKPKTSQPNALNPWTGKEGQTDADRSRNRGQEVVDEIAPQPGDIIIDKNFRPSMFFGTPLVAFLTQLQVDSCLIVGCTTSGCVRATVVDAFSYGYKVGVVEDCTFDRGEVSHRVNLFDMSQKYADVMPLTEAVAYLGRLQTSG